MGFIRRYVAVVFLVFSAVLLAQTKDPNQGQSLGDIARELRAKKGAASTTGKVTPGSPPAPATAPAPAETVKPATTDSTAVVATRSEVDEYMNEVSFQMYRGDFAKLDQMADEARSRKARFPGGGWKLFTFYAQLQMMPRDSTDAEWQKHIDFFKRWMAERPQSITARVGLAEAYDGYAWVARGNGYADQVTPEGGRLFDERLAQAADVLISASQLETKCPHWYYEFMSVALTQGMNKEQLRQIFDKGLAFAPDYYYLYQQQAHSLLPKWAGKDGDTEAFAEETYRKVGGNTGAMLYFLIAETLCSECGDFKPERYSWPTLQAGFAALEKAYGMNSIRLNDFARMAVLYEDKPVAAKAFARIGNNWEQSAWGSRGQFDAHRAWAGLGPIKDANEKSAFVLDAQATQRLNTLMGAANKAETESQWAEAAKNLHKIIDMTKPYPGTDYWILTAYYHLAVDEQRQGHTEQALSIMDEEMKVVEQRTGAESSDVATVLDARAMLEMKTNDDQKALADFLKAIAIREKAKTPAIQYGSEIYSVGMLYRKQGKNKEAVEFLKARIPAEGADPKKENWWAWPLEMMGMAYQDLGQFDEAEKAFNRMMRSLDQSLPVNSLGFVDPLSKMASLYHAMGKEAEATNVEQRLKLIQEAQGK